MARKAACLPKGTRISDYVTLGVLTTTVPGELIDAVLSDTGKQAIKLGQDLEAVAAQPRGQRVGDRVVVFDQQHTHGSRMTPP